MPRLPLNWQGRRDSNPQPNDLESFALPIRATALHSKNVHRFSLFFMPKASKNTRYLDFKAKKKEPDLGSFLTKLQDYSTISVTTPAPTVRPPSRIAKRSSFSMAIGAIKSTSN